MELNQFADYFRSIHGDSPFPWQQRLLDKLARGDGAWPKLIDLPTGSGKTACLDIALFHLAWRAARNQSTFAARRIAFVVDRRIIVDEAAARAERIKMALESADPQSAVGQVAQALRSLSDGAPLRVLTLRGGMPRERGLVRDIAEPTIILSTVDQVGSRLLFRGYGVREQASPMHAGMLGFDTLLLLDEAHIAGPMQQTLTGIVREQARAHHPWSQGPRPLTWSQLSATPEGESDFSLEHADRDHPVLSRRLNAAKHAQLVEVDDRKSLNALAIESAIEMIRSCPRIEEESIRIAIVVNRVQSARELFDQLQGKLKSSAEVLLLIGRTRPLDRDPLMLKWRARLKSSQIPRAGVLPIVVVATQTIEVGADFDFHYLIAEAASYASLRQRFGRLNRLGHQLAAAAKVVLVRKGAEDDPLYGSALLNTWKFLLTHSCEEGGQHFIDLGITAAPSSNSDLLAPKTPTPFLTPALANLLAQTCPKPLVDPDVSALLHGFCDQLPDVTVVWRSGVQAEASTEIDLELARGVLEALPPLSLEAMSLSRSAFLGWLAYKESAKTSAIADQADFESAMEMPSKAEPNGRVLVLEGDGWVSQTASKVRPGSLVVVPSEWGGCDEYGFAPESRVFVPDLAEQARLALGLRQVMLLQPARMRVASDLIQSTVRSLFDDLVKQIDHEEIVPAQSIEVVREAMSSIGEEVIYWKRFFAEKRILVEPLRVDERIKALVYMHAKPTLADYADEQMALQRGVRVELHTHCRGVAEWVARCAGYLGLPDDMTSDLSLAARLHDLGKADPRFQRRIGADSSMLLAKGPPDFTQDVDMSGARHEAYSVAVVKTHTQLIASAHDPELVLHLVGSHHGYGRALQPQVHDVGTRFSFELDGQLVHYRGSADLDAIEGGWADQFVLLNQRYGAWGLAFLETALRLADHQRSAWEVEHGDESI